MLSTDELISKAVSPLPEDLRAGATVYRYDRYRRRSMACCAVRLIRNWIGQARAGFPSAL